METLILATAVFIGMHRFAGTPLRDVVASRLGEIPFKILFAIIITASLVAMVLSYRSAPYIETWGTAEALKPLAWILMAFSFVFLLLSVTEKNPTLLGLVSPDQVEAKGILRITRHPGLIGLGLWGLSHFLVNGDWASHLLFGSFAFEGLIGPLSLDRKYRRRYGATWDAFARQTSYLPFLAIIQGRNRLVLSEIKWPMALLALILYAIVLYYHERLFGAPAL